jgi:hypothetical protein
MRHLPCVATAVDMVSTTRPYYRSTYMFVSRYRALGGLHPAGI